MSTEQGSSRPEDKTEGLSKYIKRMRTVLRKNSTAKTSSGPSMQDTTGAESGPVETPKATANPPTTTEASTAASAQQKQEQKSATRSVQPTDATVVSHWSTVQQEKARALFAKYGLSLEPGEWKSPSDMTVQRVSKPIRMRVRRTCHRCQTTFGPDRICVNCQHVRCKKCPRHPLPKNKPETTMATTAGTTAATAIATAGAARARGPADRRIKDVVHPDTPLVLPYHKYRQTEITLPSQSGGQDLVRRAVRQRVRRWCHRCEALFPSPEATECLSCGHTRCKKCPREPYAKQSLPCGYGLLRSRFANLETSPKPNKYPDGYPGDVEPPVEMPARSWRKPRQRVRYTCHRCSTIYRSGEQYCSNCGQQKGPDTIRDPPRKPRPELNPETIRRVQERLALVDVV